MRTSTGTNYSLASKILLALASIASFALLLSLAEAIAHLEAVPDTGTWLPYVAGAIFGGHAHGSALSASRSGKRDASFRRVRRSSS